MAAAFLLWAFQRIFFASLKRKIWPSHSQYHSVKKERMIASAICAVLICTGFYTTPWLKFIDQEAKVMHEQYPVHGARIDHPVFAPDDDSGQGQPSPNPHD
jgi:NADH-quinone oxidoreductase subunit M